MFFYEEKIDTKINKTRLKKKIYVIEPVFKNVKTSLKVTGLNSYIPTINSNIETENRPDKALSFENILK